MFTALLAFATKEYKFQQRKSMSRAEEEYGEAAAQGVCFGAVMMWVREKLTTNGSSWRPGPGKEFSPSRGTETHGRNSITMLHAAAHQQHYSTHGASSLADNMGLHEASHIVETVAKKDSAFRPVTVMLATLTQVGVQLPQGHAVVMELGVSDAQSGASLGGHAIGMYRSRGNHLHFFDPNIGVYQVQEIEDFMRAWLEGCRHGRGWTFSPFRKGTDWIYCYER
jgi:hypothetical protein